MAAPPANALSVGRMSSGTHQRPFPPVRCVSLAQGGTPAIVETMLAPCQVAEHPLVPLLLSRTVPPDRLVVMDRGMVSAAGLSTLVHQRQARPVVRLKVNHQTHVEHVLSEGSELVTWHPVGWPDVQVRVIASHIEPHTAERLAACPFSHTSNHADPHHLHRVVTTVLNPPLAPARERIGCSHERWEIEACMDEHKTHLRLSGQPLRRKEPAVVRQARDGRLLAHSIVCWWIHPSACQGDLDPDRLSLTYAVEVVDTACCACALVARQELPRSARSGSVGAPTPSPCVSSCRETRLFSLPSQATGTTRLYTHKAALQRHASSFHGIALQGHLADTEDIHASTSSVLSRQGGEMVRCLAPSVGLASHTGDPPTRRVEPLMVERGHLPVLPLSAWHARIAPTVQTPP